MWLWPWYFHLAQRCELAIHPPSSHADMHAPMPVKQPAYSPHVQHVDPKCGPSNQSRSHGLADPENPSLNAAYLHTCRTKGFKPEKQPSDPKRLSSRRETYMYMHAHTYAARLTPSSIRNAKRTTWLSWRCVCTARQMSPGPGQHNGASARISEGGFWKAS
jgi:hypothetical protein